MCSTVLDDCVKKCQLVVVQDRHWGWKRICRRKLFEKHFLDENPYFGPPTRSADVANLLLLLASSDRKPKRFLQRRIRENPTRFRSETVKSKRSIPFKTTGQRFMDKSQKIIRIGIWYQCTNSQKKASNMKQNEIQREKMQKSLDNHHEHGHNNRQSNHK